MKIAITADVHLRTRESHPERYNALENILVQIESEHINTLFIAGDLFDKDFHNYSDFETLCKKHPSIQIYILPGNHDPDISEKKIAGENIHIYTEPAVKAFNDSVFLFIPYKEKTKMGENIAEYESDLKGKKWVLVSHGDYYGGLKELNPLEPGTYMPFSRMDKERFSPEVVLLGHIHKACQQENVYYAGSPCGMDINETGKRRFLIYDTDGSDITPMIVATDFFYFNETFVNVPMENEIALLRREIDKRIQSWEIEPSDHSKIRVRVDVRGYAMDRSAILAVVKETFDDFTYYNGEGPCIDRLSTSSDRQLNAIAGRAIELINELDWDFGGGEPAVEQVIESALSAIYKER